MHTIVLVQEAYAGGGVTNVGSGAAALIAFGALLFIALIAAMLGRKDDGGGPLVETHKTGSDQN
jgi:hypothetical protein